MNGVPSRPQPAALFLKLGGSLITDKTIEHCAREEVIARLASEVRQALVASPHLRLVLGHGSGSFGHWVAARYGTRQGVRTPAGWVGYAEVATEAARLNRIVVDHLVKAQIPALSVQPSASARCQGGVLQALDTRPIVQALAHGLVPVVYGDVALDGELGATIISTEDIFVFLASSLRPAWILLAGEVTGVLDRSEQIVPHITPSSYPRLQDAVLGSAGVDVTGGMADKVNRMISLVEQLPETRVRIFSGRRPGLVTSLLLNPDQEIGTRLAAA